MMRAGRDYLTRMMSALRIERVERPKPIVLPEAVYDDLVARGYDMGLFIRRERIPPK